MLMHHIHDSEGPAGDAAQLPEIDFSRIGEGTVFSGARFDNDGNIYARDGSAAWQVVASWRVNGLNSAFNITRVIDSGALTTDAGAGPLILNVDRDYSVQEAVSGETETAKVTFTIKDEPGGTVTYATRQYTFEATNIL